MKALWRRWKNDGSNERLQRSTWLKKWKKTKNDKTKVVSEENKQLMKSHGKQALQIVTKLDRQLGHPGTERFVRALKDANINDSIIQCIRSFKCDICQEHGPEKLDNSSSLPQVHHFNEFLEADVFHLKWDENGGKQRLLAILDVCSRYEVNALVDRETEELELKVLERQWIQIFGPPKRFRINSSGAYVSQKYLESFFINTTLSCYSFQFRTVLVPNCYGYCRMISCNTTIAFFEIEKKRFRISPCQMPLASAANNAIACAVFRDPRHVKLSLVTTRWVKDCLMSSLMNDRLDPQQFNRTNISVTVQVVLSMKPIF